MFLSQFYTSLLIIVIVKSVDCSCRRHFLVICENLSDVRFNPEPGKWTELMIQANYSDEFQARHVLTSKHLDRNLINLKWLIINEQLVKIQTNSFTYCKNLEQFILYGNNIKEISNSTFVYFRNLSQLKLQNNNIEKLEASAFVLSKMNSVDLSFNKLQILPSHVFVKSYVNILRITNNKLWKISRNSFPRTLTVLNLDYNSFDDVSEEINEINNLQELTLSHNNLHSFPELNLQLLKKLDLSFNKISIVAEQIDSLSNLQYLDLSSNRIKKISLGRRFFSKFRDQFVLLLAHNQLRNLDLSQLGNIADVTVSFSGNPWNCKCFDRMQKFMISSDIRRTSCDQSIFSSGINPVCVADYEQCLDVEVDISLLEQFQHGYDTQIYDVFSYILE